MSFDDENHYLKSYLSTTLPNYGLDPETYGPYVTGLFPIDPEEYENEIDDDEMTNLLELLKSSSETYDDDSDGDVWDTLRNELIQRRNVFLQQELEKKVCTPLISLWVCLYIYLSY